MAAKKASAKKKAKKKNNKKKLTQKQEELSKAYILHHGNQSEAYRTVYPDSKATPESIWVLACHAFKVVKVQSRIKELQDMATEQHLVTVATLTEELDENRKVSETARQGAAMTASTVAKAKLHGYMIDKTQISGSINHTEHPLTDKQKSILEKVQDNEY